MPKRITVADECIYCGSIENRTREHVVPEALNGNLVVESGSCSQCQGIINGSIEDPLLSLTFDLLRKEMKYQSKPKRKRRSKSKRSDDAQLRTSKYNSLTVSFTRAAEPRNFSEKIILPVSQVAWLQFHYNTPPFLLTGKNKIAKQEPSIRAYFPMNDEVLEKISHIESKRKATWQTITLPDPTPNFAFDRLLCRIAAGAFFSFARDTYSASKLGGAVIGSEPIDLSMIFSAPASAFDLENFSLKVFRERESAGNFIYCAMRLLPEYLTETYFVRLPDFEQDEFSDFTVDYSNKGMLAGGTPQLGGIDLTACPSVNFQRLPTGDPNGLPHNITISRK